MSEIRRFGAEYRILEEELRHRAMCAEEMPYRFLSGLRAKLEQDCERLAIEEGAGDNPKPVRREYREVAVPEEIMGPAAYTEIKVEMWYRVTPAQHNEPSR